MELTKVRADLNALIKSHGSKRDDQFIIVDAVIEGLVAGEVTITGIGEMSDTAVAFAIYYTNGPWWLDVTQIACAIELLLVTADRWDEHLHRAAAARLAACVVAGSDDAARVMDMTYFAAAELNQAVLFTSPEDILTYFGYPNHAFTDLHKLLTLLTDLDEQYAICPTDGTELLMFPSHPMVENLPGSLMIAHAMGELVEMDHG